MDCSCHIHEICWSVYGLIITSEFQIRSGYYNCSWFMNWFCLFVFMVMTDFVFLFPQLLTIFVLVMLFWSWLCTNYDKHSFYKFIIQSRSKWCFFMIEPHPIPLGRVRSVRGLVSQNVSELVVDVDISCTCGCCGYHQFQAIAILGGPFLPYAC